jgi:hypothetical protein
MTIEQAKQVLRDNGYFVDNLWNVSDVKVVFECTDEEAQEVLYNSMNNDQTWEQIWFSIDEFGSMDNLTRKEL